MCCALGRVEDVPRAGGGRAVANDLQVPAVVGCTKSLAIPASKHEFPACRIEPCSQCLPETA
jgi:hypothetical protein